MGHAQVQLEACDRHLYNLMTLDACTAMTVA